MAIDSTTSPMPQEPIAKQYESPRGQSIAFIRQFARAYSFFGTIAVGSFVAN